MARAGDNLDEAAIFYALKEVAAHPSVVSVGKLEADERGGSVSVIVDLKLGRRWVAEGKSPTGALPHEEVRFDFPKGFPAVPPEISLRPDFNRNHPHVQPWMTHDGRVVPCLVEGDLGELIAAFGFSWIVEQLRLWLESAARGDLMDADRWEPARRDGCRDVLVLDPAKLRSVVTRDGGFKFFRMNFRCVLAEGRLTPYFLGEVLEETNAKASVGVMPVEPGSTIGHGQSVAIVVWARKDQGGKLVISDQYLPDDARTVDALLSRMAAFGTKGSLDGPLALLRAQAGGATQKTVYPLVVINLVRRPRRLNGSDSNIEILAHIAPLRAPEGGLSRPDDEVRPLGLRDKISPGLLRRMSADPELPRWAMIGCGSLGSKIALHAGRSGNAPVLVADKKELLPHNAARNGLYPPAAELQLGWLTPKAQELASALSGLGAKAEGLLGDHRDVADRLRSLKGKQRPQWLVNTTASMVVLESLALPTMADLPRIVEMSLYNGGGLGYVGVDGQSRNPNGVELEASFYQHAVASPSLARHLFAPSAGAAQIAVGQGCGSLTIKMSDATLSVITGAMTEIFSSLTEDEGGVIHTLQRDGVALAHDRIVVPPFARVPIQGLDGWTLSIAADVRRRIESETALHPTTETGGVLVGRSSMIARQIVVTDIIEAPEDSIRSRAEFQLGVSGLAERLIELHTHSGGALRCLGTWHSHLGSAKPSNVDRLSAAMVGAGYNEPMAFLILGTDGLQALCVPATIIEDPKKRTE